MIERERCFQRGAATGASAHRRRTRTGCMSSHTVESFVSMPPAAGHSHQRSGTQSPAHRVARGSSLSLSSWSACCFVVSAFPSFHDQPLSGEIAHHFISHLTFQSHFHFFSIVVDLDFHRLRGHCHRSGERSGGKLVLLLLLLLDFFLLV